MKIAYKFKLSMPAEGGGRYEPCTSGEIDVENPLVDSDKLAYDFGAAVRGLFESIKQSWMYETSGPEYKAAHTAECARLAAKLRVP